MKNYPNQASSFERVRGTLQVIGDLNAQGANPLADDVLGFAAVRAGVYTFRNLDNPTRQQLATRIAQERAKPPESQGVRTFARELRRTLRDMGWVDQQSAITLDGQAVLASTPGSVDEQALLVAGLLNIAVTDAQGNTHHPVRVMLRLLAEHPSPQRDGLELALAPLNDTAQEFERILPLYQLDRQARMGALGISDHQRANAVKIFPTLALYAGLVVVDGDHDWSLSLDGWNVLGAAPAAARQTIRRRRGRRTTQGRLVGAAAAGQERQTAPPRTLSAEEQARAAERLQERTTSHQELVRRIAGLIGDHHGQLFEDQFSYDLLWVPTNGAEPALLFEMKSITSQTDAYSRVRDAAGQLSYYEFFHVAATLGTRAVTRVAAFDSAVPSELVDYLTHEGVAAIVAPTGTPATGLNQAGEAVLAKLPMTPAAPRP